MTLIEKWQPYRKGHRMRSLRITLRTSRPIVLPLAYNELAQGLVYSCWASQMPHVHEYRLEDGRDFRPFVFGRLEGPCRVDSQKRTIKFFELVSLEVRSVAEELIEMCATQLADRRSIRLGAYDLELVNLECCDRLLFPRRCVARLRTPAVVYQTTDDGHTTPFSPTDTQWLPLIQQNARRKAEALGLGCDTTLQALAYEETLRKQVTRFKGTYLTGYTGDILLSADPQLMAALWCCGLGVRNSQGFGMFDILDTRTNS